MPAGTGFTLVNPLVIGLSSAYFVNRNLPLATAGSGR